MTIDATLVTAICIAAGLLARCILTVHAENRRQHRIVRRAARKIVRLRRELREQWDRNEVLREELVAYREEAGRPAAEALN